MEHLTEQTYVRYGASGICKVLRRETLSDSRGTGDYYLLQPVSETQTTIYIPADNRLLLSRVAPVPTKEDIHRAICATADGQALWAADRNDRSRQFAAILKEGDPTRLLLLVNCIYQKKQELLAGRKKLSSSDEGVLKRAERALQRDLAFVLDLREEEVGPYIRRLLHISE